ncbi:hypothetical protein [Roseobacter sp. CCS2]|uniref:hypothetical protein n=1 Tax=Roseobacter sp. CCS2 TaxID=391593 RepID=UPI0000F3E2BE|nr:hypothetical protein [Roseobacter sp. CCS2]EBA12015.1 hypothetical protein RCCS2_11999 [Roseobacter sp. CCS2]
MKRSITMLALATVIALPATTLPAVADSHINLDRVEDRIDRRESRRDERVDLGRRDVIEDRIDRVESVLDRRGIENTPRIDRQERRSWVRRWN